MDIYLKIHHKHSMTGKKHQLLVKTNTNDSIHDLKEAIAEQYPSKVNYFIAPARFQKIILHGQIWEDAVTVHDMLSRIDRIYPSHVYPSRISQGRIILLQFPRTDHHLKQVHDIITDDEKNIHPLRLAKSCGISMSRVMQIIHFLEAAGFIQIDSSASTRHHSRHQSLAHSEPIVHPNPIMDSIEEADILAEIEEDLEDLQDQLHDDLSPMMTGRRASAPFVEHSHEMDGVAPLLSRNSSTNSLLSDVGDIEEQELLRSSFVRLVIGQLAQQLMFNDEDDCNANVGSDGNVADDEKSDHVDH